MTIIDRAETVRAPERLLGVWVHSREEDSGGLETYRREDFDFPPSFGRTSFDIRPGGRFVLREPGPADGTEELAGQWRLGSERHLAVRFPDGQHAGFVLEIVQLDGHVLRVHRHQRLAEQAATELDDDDLDHYRKLSPPQSVRLIDFRDAHVFTARGRHVLRVSGTHRFADMTVSLNPVVYVRQPEYWEIEVVGSLHEAGIQTATNFCVSRPLNGTLGTRGIDVVGATSSERFDISSSSHDNGKGVSA